ncbi:MAG: hypothetical protein ACRENN_10500 [Candidatus Eiseniibacteriota bacterium]
MVAVALALALPGTAAATARAPGTGVSPAGSGINTAAATSNSIYQFDAPAAPPDVTPCDGCPSETGQGDPSVSS